MKIAVIGYSGSGKSTLARRLGSLTGDPVLHLDTVQFVPGWVERDRDEAHALVSRFMDEHAGWVIDGNYRRFCSERRFAEADLIAFLDYPRRVCVPQALARWWRFRGTGRPDMAAGCPERFDLAFLLWLLHGGRTPERRAWYERVCEEHAGKVASLRSRAEVEAWVARLS